MIWNLSAVIITPEMLNIIGELDEFKGAWQLLGHLAPDRLQVLRKVATIESIGSSTRIEGSKLSDREVERLLSNVSTYSFASRDEQEVAGYALACEEIFQHHDSISFTENIVKQFHAWLLQYSDKDQRYRGEYKKFSNHVEAFDENGKSLGVIFETSTPFETPQKMEELILWTRERLGSKALHPLLVIGIFIVAFLAIHPFQDGNGRLSRILTTLLLLKSGYLYMPYSSLESIIEKNKESYFLALRRTQGSLKNDSPDFTPWLHFYLRSLQKQKTHLEIKISKEKMINYHVSELSGQILTLLLDHGRLSIGDIEKMSGANRATIKSHLSELVKNGTINRLGKGRATWYVLA